MAPDAAGDVDGALAGAGCAPAARGREGRAEGPRISDGVEDHGARERGEEVVVGAGEEDKGASGGDGLDGEVAREEGGVAEEEVVEGRVGRWWREGVPVG